MLTCPDWYAVAAIAGAASAAAAMLLARAQRRRYMRQFERMAFHDPLTDLPNRLLFIDRALDGGPSSAGVPAQRLSRFAL